MSFTRLFLFTSAVFIFAGCGSLSYHARHQYILVQSNPPGAPVYYQGQYKGTTPTFVEIRRQRENELQILDGPSWKPVNVESEYRWSGSFWANFAFLYFAPIGWGVDWATGGAWHMQDPNSIQLVTRPKLISRPAPVAIAPPKAGDVELSDEGGLLWQDELPQKFKNIRLTPYRATLPKFASYGYDFDMRPDRQEEYELFAKLGITDVFESSMKELDDGVELRGRFRNVYTGQMGPEQVIDTIPQSKGSEPPWYERFKKIIHLIPNTIGLEWSPADSELTTSNGITYRSQPATATGWGAVLPYLSSITLSRLTPPRRDAKGRFHFELVPSVRTSYRRIFFPNFQPISANEFGYLNIGAGLGPEIGWQWGPNYAYINVIPMYGWHRLAWEIDDQLHAISIGALTSRSEIGYLYFITDRFSANIFVKNTSTPDQLWNSAIQNISPGAPQVNSTSEVVSFGLEFAYTWQPSRDIRQWQKLKK